MQCCFVEGREKVNTISAYNACYTQVLGTIEAT